MQPLRIIYRVVHQFDGNLSYYCIEAVSTLPNGSTVVYSDGYRLCSFAKAAMLAQLYQLLGAIPPPTALQLLS